MTHLIAQWIDKGIMILAAFLLLRFYFKPGAKYLYKKKWVPFACVFMVLYSVVDIGLTYREHSKTRIPSKAELERTMLANNTLAEADLVYRSPHGYSILVPKGYAYTHFASGPVSLTVFKDNSTVVVSKLPTISDPLDKTAQDTCRYLKQKNSTYSFSAPESVQVGKTPAIRLTAQVTKESVLIEGVLLFFKNDGQLFQVICSCPEAVFQENKNQFESIIASLALD